MTRSAVIFPRSETPTTTARPPGRTRHPIRIGDADLRVLCALARYDRLTALQITRLLYRPGTLTTVQARLKGLTEAGVLGRDFGHGPRRAGSAPWIYGLARRGMAAVTELGIALPRSRRADDTRGFLFYDHTLLVNDILITVDLLARSHPHIHLERVLHERLLKRHPLQVEIPTTDHGGGARQVTVRLIPDAFLDLRVVDPGDPYRLNLAIEADRATEDQTTWRMKIRAYLAALAGSYQRQFAARSLTIAVVTTGGDARVHHLIRWTEHELTSQHREASAPLFQITTTPPDWERCDPVAFAGDARWWRPFAPDPAPLLRVGEGTPR